MHLCSPNSIKWYRPRTITVKSWEGRKGWACQKVMTQYSNNSFGDRCFAAAGPRLWNTLPIHLRHCDSLGQFKRLLKTCLFGGWDRGALWHLLGAPCINYLTYLLTYYCWVYNYHHPLAVCLINQWSAPARTVLWTMGVPYLTSLYIALSLSMSVTLFVCHGWPVWWAYLFSVFCHSIWQVNSLNTLGLRYLYMWWHYTHHLYSLLMKCTDIDQT